MKKIIISFLAIGLIASSCKKNDDFFKKDEIGFKSGFIKANIVGTSQDNIALNESITAEYVSATDLTRSSTYSIDDNGNTVFNFQRSMDLIGNNYISFNITKFKTTGTVSLTRFSLTYQKKIDEKQVLSLDYYNYNVESISTITNLVFDETTGSLKGSYLITKVTNDNGVSHTATISGDFDVHVVKELN